MAGSGAELKTCSFAEAFGNLSDHRTLMGHSSCWNLQHTADRFFVQGDR
jgi:hypothetical protein